MTLIKTNLLPVHLNHELYLIKECQRSIEVLGIDSEELLDGKLKQKVELAYNRVHPYLKNPGEVGLLLGIQKGYLKAI